MNYSIRRISLKNNIPLFIISFIHFIFGFLAGENIFIFFTLFSSLFLFSYSNFQKNYILIIKYLFVFIINLLLGITEWQSNFDWLDIFSLVLFLFILPILYLSICEKYVHVIEKSLFLFWISITILIGVWTLGVGIDWTRGTILGIKSLQKNSVGIYYEIIVIYLYFSEFNHMFSKSKIAIISILTLFLIGSKTSMILLPAFIFLGNQIYISRNYLFSLIILLIGFIWFNISSFIQFFEYKISYYTVYLRLLLWESGKKNIFKNNYTIFFGRGPGTFITNKFENAALHNLNNMHNYILTIFYSYGLIGFLLLMIYFYNLINLKVSNKNAILSFLIFFFHSQFDVGLVKGSGFIVSFIIGMIFNSSFNNKKSAKYLY